MACLHTFLSSLWPQKGYARLNKKDDDEGIQRAQQWKQAHHSDHCFENLTNDKLSRIACCIVKDLRTVEVDSSNQELVKEHLVALGKQSDRLRQYLVQQLQSLQVDPSIRSDLQGSVILTYTNKV